MAKDRMRKGMYAMSLRVEGLEDAIGVDEPRPRFSWQVRADSSEQGHCGYRIVVASRPEQLNGTQDALWDSGWIAGAQQFEVAYSGRALRPLTRYFWHVELAEDLGDARQVSEPATWVTGLMDPSAVTAEWIGFSTPTAGPARPVYMRREFELCSPVEEALLVASALGVYETYINGQKVGDRYLAPEWTNYHRRVQYQTYDVTSMLRDGVNTIAAILGNGWYSGDWQHWESELRPIYGGTTYFLAELHIQRRTGTPLVIASDNTWLARDDGELEFAGIYEGASIDARKQFPGWSLPGHSLEGWQPVTVAAPSVKRGSLVTQKSPPIRVTEILHPTLLSQPLPGVWVFDLGQNISGWCTLTVNESAGSKVTLAYNEMLNPDGTLYMDNLHAGLLSTGRRQVDEFVSAGVPRVFEPMFTYHGFRYVQVAGLEHAPVLADLEGVVVHTDMERTGTFRSSHQGLSRLAENIAWSQRANTMGVPTDCPQRDERCGYTGDAAFFIDTAVYNFDQAAFYDKWMVDLCEDSQLEEGWYADHAPWYGPGAGPNVGWCDSGIFIAHRLFRTYASEAMIRRVYPSLRRNIEWQISTSRDDLREQPIGVGDWLALTDLGNDALIGSAHYARSLRLMAELASVAGFDQDAGRYRELGNRAHHAFADRYFTADGALEGGGQTSYALAFDFDLVPGRLHADTRRHFEKEIKKAGHLTTGFIGTPRLLPGLRKAELAGLAAELLLRNKAPSWLFAVDQGATTIWERWNSWSPTEGFADPRMNSFNHYALGAVGSYLFGDVAGIRDLSPGYARTLVAPVLLPGIDWIEATYTTVSGRIEVGWAVTGSSAAVVSLAVPPNMVVQFDTPPGWRQREGDRRLETLMPGTYRIALEKLAGEGPL